MADEMSTEPTPENLKDAAATALSPYNRYLRAAADLIEAQQARIDELEAALHDLVEFVPGHHLSHADHDHDCYELRCLNIDNARFVLAESPDTPETRP